LPAIAAAPPPPDIEIDPAASTLPSSWKVA